MNNLWVFNFQSYHRRLVEQNRFNCRSKMAPETLRSLGTTTIDNVFFAGIQTCSIIGEAMVWQGKEYVAGKEPPLLAFREIIWELCKWIFHYELIMLDHHACANLTFSDLDMDQLFYQQELISKCFVDPLFDVVPFHQQMLVLLLTIFECGFPMSTHWSLS